MQTHRKHSKQSNRTRVMGIQRYILYARCDRTTRWWTARCLTQHNWKYAWALIAYDDAVHVFNCWMCSACINTHLHTYTCSTHIFMLVYENISPVQCGNIFGWDYKGQPPPHIPKKPLIVPARLVCMHVCSMSWCTCTRTTYKRIPRWPCPWRVPKSNVQKFHHQPEWWADKIKRQRVQHKDDLTLVYSYRNVLAITHELIGQSVYMVGLRRTWSQPNPIINMSIIKSIIYNRCRLGIYSLHRREHAHTIWSIIVWSKWSSADRAVSVSNCKRGPVRRFFIMCP